MEIDEYEFKDWVERRVACGMALNKCYEDPKAECWRVEEAVDALTAMELVCYLGEYLSCGGKS